jgi:acyl-CoA dehydrogenase
MILCYATNQVSDNGASKHKCKIPRPIQFLGFILVVEATALEYTNPQGRVTKFVGYRYAGGGGALDIKYIRDDRTGLDHPCFNKHSRAPSAYSNETSRKNTITMQDPIHLTEEMRLIRAQVRRFVAEEIVPRGEAWEADGMVPREVLRHMGELGFLGMRHPEDYGGSGLGAMASLILSEELGRSTFGGFSATVLVHTDMASPHLARYGSSAQKERYLPAICRGEIITAVAVTEPGAGSDVAGLACRAVADGDDYLLNGAKMFITNGVHGDLFFVATRTDPDVKGSRGISIFMVEKDTPGFAVSRQLDKHGWRCSDTAELAFTDCRIPRANLLGEENKGFYAIMDNFQNERLVLSGMAIGEAGKALEITLAYLKERQAFDGTLWDKQGIRQRLAMLAAQVEAARQLAYHVAWLDSEGQDCVAEVSMLKAMSAEVVNRMLYDCVQFHGGMGYMRESTIERMSRDARLLPIGGGATEVMLEEVAKRL